jgi:hypothetical protein
VDAPDAGGCIDIFGDALRAQQPRDEQEDEFLVLSLLQPRRK